MINTEDISDHISTLQVNPGDVVLFRFGPDMLPKDLQPIYDSLTSAFPDNQVIGLAKDIDVLIQSPKEAIDMLEKMITKIKLIHPEVVKPNILGV